MSKSAIGSCAAVLLAAACGGGGGGGGGAGGAGSGSGNFHLLLTDKPFAHDIVEEALIHVSEIRVHQDAQADSGFIDLDIGAGVDFDLLNLQNGVTVELANANLPVGTYGQVRLVVDEASLKLVNGNTYSTEQGNLKLTSTGTSGIKIFVNPPIEVTDTPSTLLLDFDLSKSFHAVPANDPLTATSYLLMPVIRATNLSDTVGDIRGHVTQDDGTGTQVGVDAATVFLMPPGETDPANSLASTGTIADGSYALLGLTPGTYDLLAEKDLQQGTLIGVTVTGGSVTTADIVLQPGTVGEIHGLVTQDDGTGTQVAVDAATVYLMPPGETDPANSLASAATIADGSYALLDLAPGTYDLLAVKDLQQGTLVGVTVIAGSVTTAADIVLLPGPVGEIHGLVTQDDGTGNQVAVDAATVFLMPPGVTDPANSLASTTTIADGSYALVGVAPGTYDLLAVKDPKEGTVLGVAVTAGSVTTAANIVIQ